MYAIRSYYALFVQRDLLEKSECLPGRPPKRLKQFTGIEQFRNQPTMSCRLMDSNQQIKQLTIIATVLFQGILQWELPRLAFVVVPGGIGS